MNIKHTIEAYAKDHPEVFKMKPLKVSRLLFDGKLTKKERIYVSSLLFEKRNLVKTINVEPVTESPRLGVRWHFPTMDLLRQYRSYG